MPEDQLREIMANHGFNVANMSYRITDDGSYFEYRMVLQTADVNNTSTLATYLLNLKQVHTFQISPTGD
jgi:putative Mg2+ transporter-C (MgtC) family protein